MADKIMLKDFPEVGDEVYFNDPEDNISSGYYTIEKILADEPGDIFDDSIVVLRHEDGHTIEAFMFELS